MRYSEYPHEGFRCTHAGDALRVLTRGTPSTYAESAFGISGILVVGSSCGGTRSTHTGYSECCCGGGGAFGMSRILLVGSSWPFCITYEPTFARSASSFSSSVFHPKSTYLREYFKGTLGYSGVL